MTRYVGKTFRNEEIQIDSAEYESCRFENCKLVYSGGEIYFGNCYFNGGVTWCFSDAAGTTVQFMANMYAMGGGGRQLVEDIVRTIMQREHWNAKTRKLPAICEICFTVFGLGNNFNNAQYVYFADCVVDGCPRCGGIGRVYGSIGGAGNLNITINQFADEVFTVICHNDIPVSDIEKLITLARSVSERRMPISELAEAIKTQASSLAQFAHILTPKLAGDLYQLLTVATYVLEHKSEDNLTLVDELVEEKLINELERGAM